MAKDANTTQSAAPVAEDINPTPAGSISMEQLAVLLKGFAAEIKKPDEETQARNEEVKARKLAAKAANIEAWKAEKAATQQRQDACGHVKENGKHNFVGQVHGNGLCKAICQTCHWCSDWFEPFSEMVNGGAELRDFGGLTRTIIDQRVAAHKSKQLVSNVATGTAPFTVTGTTVVPNLNADKLVTK